jgi:hypothetical protein
MRSLTALMPPVPHNTVLFVVPSDVASLISVGNCDSLRDSIDSEFIFPMNHSPLRSGCSKHVLTPYCMSRCIYSSCRCLGGVWKFAVFVSCPRAVTQQRVCVSSG